jgi:hypothetical protein
MTVMRRASMLALLLALAGCATSVPFEKSPYVGEWEGDSSYLLITQDGYVFYERFRGPFINTLDGRLKGFKGDNVQVGLGPLAMTIKVNVPPYLEGRHWKMVVDDMELVRIGD